VLPNAGRFNETFVEAMAQYHSLLSESRTQEWGRWCRIWIWSPTRPRPRQAKRDRWHGGTFTIPLNLQSMRTLRTMGWRLRSSPEFSLWAA